MASADFSPFVVTDGFHTLFPSADETSLGTTRHFLSIHLPHILQLTPSSYWALACYAALSLTIASCDFCSSDQRFASTFLQIPPRDGHPWCSAVSFPLLGRIRNFHPLATCAARRTYKKGSDHTQSLPFLYISGLNIRRMHSHPRSASDRFWRYFSVTSRQTGKSVSKS